MAENCAEDWYRNHAGWESQWPIELNVISNGVNLGTFVVHCEYDPTFSAYKKKEESNGNSN
jgi:hypothetical protein